MRLGHGHASETLMSRSFRSKKLSTPAKETLPKQASDHFAINEPYQVTRAQTLASKPASTEIPRGSGAYHTSGKRFVHLAGDKRLVGQQKAGRGPRTSVLFAAL